MKILYGLIILGVLGTFMACESENEQDLFTMPAPPPPMRDTTMMDTTMMDTTMRAVSFSMTIAPLFQNSCAIPGCHVANSQSPTMQTYAQIKLQADRGRIRERALNRMTMPPSGRPRLTTQEKEDLRSWLDNGAPNN